LKSFSGTRIAYVSENLIGVSHVFKARFFHRPGGVPAGQRRCLCRSALPAGAHCRCDRRKRQPVVTGEPLLFQSIPSLGNVTLEKIVWWGYRNPL
jgi:hypothetical protein